MRIGFLSLEEFVAAVPKEDLKQTIIDAAGLKGDEATRALGRLVPAQLGRCEQVSPTEKDLSFHRS